VVDVVVEAVDEAEVVEVAITELVVVEAVVVDVVLANEVAVVVLERGMATAGGVVDERMDGVVAMVGVVVATGVNGPRVAVVPVVVALELAPDTRVDEAEVLAVVTSPTISMTA
jgi:hypothetical protein